MGDPRFPYATPNRPAASTESPINGLLPPYPVAAL